MRFLFLHVLLVAQSLGLAAQVGVRATVDSSRLLPGDRMHLRVEVEPAPGTAISDPVWPEAKPPFEWLSFGKWDSLPNGTLLVDAQFTFWDTGRQEVPPVAVVFHRQGGVDTAWSNTLSLQVLPPADSLQLTDIKDIAREPAQWTDYLLHLVLLGVLALAALGLWWWRRPAKPTPEAAPPPSLPPHEIARQRLAVLAKQKLWQQGQVKEYHSELTHIFREYLEGRYGIRALEATTDEVLDQLRPLQLPDAMLRHLSDILQIADLVKFAKAEPPAEFHEDALSQVQAFVEETKTGEG